MITLKQALELVQIFQKIYPKVDHCKNWEAFVHEEKLRTSLARTIAADNPPLDPDNPQDLTLDSLALSTILSPDAQKLFEQYKVLLEKRFNIRVSPAINNFADIRETFKHLRRHSQEGGAMTWSKEELKAFRKLCEQLALDNGLIFTQVMSDFTTFGDDELVVTKYSIELAKQLFRILGS